MTEKFCKDCKHMSKTAWGASLCYGPQHAVDPVWGVRKPNPCMYERQENTHYATCGSTGKHFEPRGRRWWEFWR
jgi:hypothetical protein